MIITIEELQKHPEFQNQDVSFLSLMIESVESLIRAYANNNFQNRNIRFEADSVATVLNGSSPFLKVGDTIQISGSVNKGLYVVKDINDESIVVDRPLFTVPFNLVTKVEYPPDIRLGVINLLKWEIQNRDKVGLKSETISRHSVTYYDQDSNNQVMGYPVSLLGFLKPYMKARF